MPLFIERLSPLLLNTPLLSLLSKLQRSLDSLDIEGLSRLWAQYHSGPIGSGIPDPTMDEWASFTKMYLDTHPPAPTQIDQLAWIDKERLRYYILAYLFSATFKDCSVILHFDSGLEDSITVIDLDPKKVGKLQKWEVHDREIVMAFKKALEKGEVTIPPCVDSYHG
jgi:inositol-pentakisphosphate 2-kinase